MENNRHETEMPMAVEEWGWKYHHLGVPTKEKKPNEHYLPQFKFYVSGFSTSPFGVEWMRFDEDCEMHPLIQTIPHLAFVVDNLDKELLRPELNLLNPPNLPMEGLRVAMVEHDGAPIELMEFSEYP
ncbi:MULTISPECIES: hypothetical protein [unclassified Lentimicrobium]|uniref:hypothetical protein n=1 Tax=unclassified Lentimicrobium TaxID=2677434 RepID=UPI0015560CC1|nr:MULTISPECIES: hypothetical protein [unclassified Lentimicrobium]NPD44006.1 hypothetical protein [Lentimicrobium sp. S6]NPD84080.1 hypothetical protein [Lentimicrobium sp. L6]